MATVTPPEPLPERELICRFSYRLYRRPFRHPLHTRHGKWTNREGIIVKLTAPDGRQGWGDIAPIPWFGSESIDRAIAWCKQAGSSLSGTDIAQLPTNLPASQFGFETAWLQVVQPSTSMVSLPKCGLLPTGSPALDAWSSLWQQGYRTFKWKIGLTDCHRELALLDNLLEQLPATAKLRLDANGGLDWGNTCTWLKTLDRRSSEEAATIEFLEQPLPPSSFPELLRLSGRFSTPLALDESVAQLPDLERCYLEGWRGVWVLKPAIAGSPRRLQQLCQTYTLDTVFSSALETTIGQQHALAIASACHTQRAVGFGVNHWFVPEPSNWLEQLWHSS